jgi:dienelactone hydrolase
MWRCFAEPLDRLAIRSARGAVLPSPDGQSHAEEAAAFLHAPNFFCPQLDPARLEFHGKTSFQFPSSVHSDSRCNELVRGRWEFAATVWQQRPSVILLHGWNAELQYQWQLPYWSQLLARAGVNAFRFELPYHCSRRPAAPGAICNFLSGNLLHVMRATHQALADVRALALWLRAQGSPSVGIWGVSLGGWLGGLAAAHQPEIDFAALLTPVVRMDRALQELAFCDPIRDHLRGLDQQFQPLNLMTHQPACGAANVLLVASQLDLFAPVATIDELELAWERPEVWRLPHGHISVLFSNRVMRRIARWLARKAEACARFDTAPESA